MTPTTDLNNLRQTSGLIELFELDLTSYGSSAFYFTSSESATGYVTLGTRQYYSLPISMTGTEITSSGSMPRPQLSVGVTGNKILLSARVQYGDMAGCPVVKYCTFAKYLATGSSPDPTAILPREKYIISHIVSQTNEVLTWELRLPIDVKTVLPRKQFLKDDTPNNVWAPGMARL